MTPRQELDYDYELPIGGPLVAGSTFQSVGQDGSWFGVVEFATQDDAIVLINRVDFGRFKPGERIHFVWSTQIRTFQSLG